VVLTGGQVSDVKGYAPVMAEPGPAPIRCSSPTTATTPTPSSQTCRIAASPRSSRPSAIEKVQPIIDGHLSALRNLVERCGSKLKHSRRLAARNDKTADSYIGIVLVAVIRLWVRHFVNRT
jgi:transposase